MLNVKCPKCSTALKLAAAPPSGRVKCPQCATVIAVKGAPAGKTPAQGRPAAAAKVVDPNDENFDFGRISFPTASTTAAVSQFPSSGAQSVYTGPIPGDPLEMENGAAGGADAAAGGKGSAGGSRKKKPGLSKKSKIRIAIGLGLLIVCSAIAGVVWMTRLS
ncbi:hypothetical protein K227x_28510 [Rubripirellula lacrimiformis]|uniref:Uncharacterized protein n=1 Tax=Rubripirellula lacrimiformis TaxID=1930273 RepID=A0A517NBG2_9BACT|nr:hypothetical protein [Rubripirellula lacrimiformis]QDT04460.1 hypothetical protein K227x_28510 [Rubripirellula lacrimiformis]